MYVGRLPRASTHGVFALVLWPVTAVSAMLPHVVTLDQTFAHSESEGLVWLNVSFVNGCGATPLARQGWEDCLLCEFCETIQMTRHLQKHQVVP